MRKEARRMRALPAHPPLHSGAIRAMGRGSMTYPPTTATVETLANGLTLILEPDPAAPVVSAQVWVDTGSMHEDHHLGSGLSHFLEHMVFKGTRDMDGETLASTVQAAGGHWNAYTSFDRTVYYIDGPSHSLPVFLETLAGLVFFPTLPESEFEKEMDVIRREIDMGLDDPDNAAMRLLLSTAFTADPRRHPVIGHRHLFDRITWQDLMDYHRRRYTPDRCFVVISGDFDPDEARKTIDALTAGCQAACGADPWIPADEPQLGPREARGTFAVPTSRISLAWKTPPLDHPDAPVFDVLAAVLGKGRASRLHRTLRDEAGLALEISAFSWNQPGREGLIVVSAEAEPDNRDALIEAIRRELDALPDSPLDGEIARAKRQIAVSQFRNLTTASGRASDLGSNWHETRDLDFTRHYLAAIQAVSTDDVLRAAGRMCAGRTIRTILDPLECAPPARRGKPNSHRGGVETHTLPNGLTIALLSDPRVPLIHFQAAVRAGLPSETPETSGLNQLLAATLPKGTTDRSANEIALALESLGASIHASGGNNALLVRASGLAADAAVIADVFAEVMLRPAFFDDTLSREKASQRATLEESMQDPLHSAFRLLRQTVFPAGGYGLDALGRRESLEKIDRPALQAHHARHFNAANTILAAAGDFEPSAIIELLESAFATMPAGARWQHPATVTRAGESAVTRLPKKQAVLTIGFPGATAVSPERHTLAMLQEYAADMAGPLFGRIREDLGLAYQVGATQFLGHDAGLFTFYLATSPEQVETARTELLAEIGKIAAHGIPDEAFERVRATVLSGIAIQQQSPASVANHVALDLLFGHPADEYRRVIEVFRTLTPEQVRLTAARVFSQAATEATVLPESI
jgi:zinc protease